MVSIVMRCGRAALERDRSFPSSCVCPAIGRCNADTFAEEVEREIRTALPGATVFTHLEPSAIQQLGRTPHWTDFSRRLHCRHKLETVKLVFDARCVAAIRHRGKLIAWWSWTMWKGKKMTKTIRHSLRGQ